MKEDNTYYYYDEMDGLELSGSLRVNPFVIPENYFENFPSSVFSQIHLQHLSDPKKTDFLVPDTYFSELTGRIQFHLKMEQYKDAEHVTTWSIPKRYFEDLSQGIISQTNIDTVGKQEKFEVPTGYFEDFSERIQTKVLEEKLKEQVSTDGFAIPTSYADTLKSNIIVQTVEKEEPKIKIRKLNFNVWIRYAAVACIVMALGIVSYNAINKYSQTNHIESHLSSIPEEEIINYLSASNNSDDILYIMEHIYQPSESEGICNQIEENDIEDYLNYSL